MSEQCVGSEITFPDTGSEFNEYLIQVDPASETPASVVVIEWPEYITELTPLCTANEETILSYTGSPLISSTFIVSIEDRTITIDPSTDIFNKL